MFWKILGVVVLVWITLAILGAILKLVFPLIALAAVGTGLYLLYRATIGRGDALKEPF